jgi:hypothetical protein
MGTVMTHPSSQATLPKDHPARNFTLAQSDDPNLPHIGVVGDTYTILVTGKDTAGHYALFDMNILRTSLSVVHNAHRPRRG